MAVRNPARGKQARDDILKLHPDAALDLMQLDVGALSSVREFAAAFSAKYDRLDILLNNAGLMAIPRQETVDGFEMQLGVNHLGHFALTGLLIDTIVKTPKARIHNVTSGANFTGRINFDDLMGKRSYGRWEAYGQSKLANVFFTQYQAEEIIAQSRRALDYLPSDNLQFRFTATWALAFAHHLQGDRTAAIRAYREAIAISQASGDRFSTILATDSLSQVQELENQLFSAAEAYRRVLELSGEHPQPNIGETQLGLARIAYEWNDLEAAERHGQQALQLMRQYDRVIDRYVMGEMFLACLKLAHGDTAGAAALIAQAEHSVRRHNFAQRMPEVAAVQVLVLLRQGNLAAAAQLAKTFGLPISQARVHLAQGDPAAALALLEPLHQQMEAKGWQDERLRVMVLQAVAHYAHGEEEQAVRLLADALALAEPGGFIRLFVDEGEPMAELLDMRIQEGRGTRSYLDRLLTAFDRPADTHPASLTPHPLLEPLSQRELEILRLIAHGLSNQEIGERLFLSLSTVKGHNRRIFDKLQVQRRTEAVARAREVGLL